MHTNLRSVQATVIRPLVAHSLDVDRRTSTEPYVRQRQLRTVGERCLRLTLAVVKALQKSNEGRQFLSAEALRELLLVIDQARLDLYEQFLAFRR